MELDRETPRSYCRGRSFLCVKMASLIFCFVIALCFALGTSLELNVRDICQTGAITKCIYKGWLGGWLFWFNGPLRQYFSLYRTVSQREGGREEKG